MRRAVIALSMTSFVGAFALPAFAQTALPAYARQTCRQWLEIHQEPAQAAAADSWVLGYVEGLAKFTDANRAIKGLPATGALKGLDGPTIVALMERSCRGNPRRSVSDAISGLSAELLASEPTVVQGPVR